MVLTQELRIAYTRIFFVELAYWIISIGMVFVNEFVLNDQMLIDDLTIFITIVQIIIALSILITLNQATKHCIVDETTLDQGDKEALSVFVYAKSVDHVELNNSNDETSDQDLEYNRSPLDAKQKSYDTDKLSNLFIVNIPQRINLETCKLVFPLSILYVGMLLLSNFCLKYVGVAFYFVSRSLTTVFNVIFTHFLINEPVSRGTLLCCAFIVLGFLLGIDQESIFGNLSILGLVFGVTSSLFTSLFSIYTKKTLAKLDKNIWLVVLYNNLNAIALCTPLLIVHGDIQALITDKIVSVKFWLLLALSGVMAFFISIATNASIKYTSPLTHNISGTAKACLQTVIAVICSNEHKSVLWWVSNVIILVASAAYSRIKQFEMERKMISTNRIEMNETKASET